MPNRRAKVFWTGRSQAVRLPKEFRFQGDSVLVRREGAAVILEPVDEWPEGYVESFVGMPEGRAHLLVPRHDALTRSLDGPMTRLRPTTHPRS
jgi:virulence-associated protein VagC